MTVAPRPVGHSVLVVDDDEMVRAIFVRALRGAGFDTREATDGIEALDAVGARLPDVVLLDSRMPGLDGIEVLIRLRADPRTRDLAVVMVTGQGDLDARVAGLDAGADDYLAKPLHPDELVARVRAQLRGRANRSAAGGASPDYDPDYDPDHDADAVIERVHAAIRGASYHPVFQPIVRLTDRHVEGYEALTRFDDGRGPDAWFAEARRAGAHLELERTTLAAAVSRATALPEGRYVSLNVSCALLGANALVDELVRLDRPLVLEITEHEPVHDYDEVRRSIDALATTLPFSVRLAVDDAGAGFASLRHILDLAPAVIKLDIRWIRGIDGDAPRQTLVAGLVRFAEETGAVTVAEGIETEAEARTVQALGVTLGQGYLLGRPARVAGLE